jgi:hypothetical protein
MLSTCLLSPGDSFVRKGHRHDGGILGTDGHFDGYHVAAIVHRDGC